MWTYLPTWLVQDGEVEELAPGSFLLTTALAANCATVMTVDGSWSPGLVPAKAAVDGYRYDVTGMAGAVRDIVADRGDGRSVRFGSEFLLTSGVLRFIARTNDLFVDEVAGSMVTARCSLEVLAGYEMDAFSLPDVREDWVVASVQLERRVVKHRMVNGLKGRLMAEGYAGNVVDLIEVPRMRKWADDPAAALKPAAKDTTATYVVDLRLFRPEGHQPYSAMD